ncbi:MAG: DUF1249 domain-containing protein [Marinicellaceae bacterium]
MLKTKKQSLISKNAYTNQNCVSIQHEDNFQLLNLLMPHKLLDGFCYQSNLTEKPQLFINVINQFKYTTELIFKYSFEFGNSEEIVVKIYHDAQVAEIVYCTDLQQFIRLLGPKISPKIHKKTRGSLNVFLNKWLSFLIKNGYSQNHWQIVKKCSK